MKAKMSSKEDEKEKKEAAALLAAARKSGIKMGVSIIPWQRCTVCKRPNTVVRGTFREQFKYGGIQFFCGVDPLHRTEVIPDRKLKT